MDSETSASRLLHQFQQPLRSLAAPTAIMSSSQQSGNNELIDHSANRANQKRKQDYYDSLALDPASKKQKTDLRRDSGYDPNLVSPTPLVVVPNIEYDGSGRRVVVPRPRMPLEGCLRGDDASEAVAKEMVSSLLSFGIAISVSSELLLKPHLLDPGYFCERYEARIRQVKCGVDAVEPTSGERGYLGLERQSQKSFLR